MQRISEFTPWSVKFARTETSRSNRHEEGSDDNRCGETDAPRKPSYLQRLIDSFDRGAGTGGGLSPKLPEIEAPQLPEFHLVDIGKFWWDDDSGSVFHGTNFRDWAYGNGGDDYIRLNGGDDYAYGGDGDDRLYGNAGDDTVSGGDGNDRLEGNSGNDSMYGGNGTDRMYGGTGDDYMKGDAWSDFLYGGDGNDALHGGTGTDNLQGGDGNDSLLGGNDNDQLYGGDGNDYMLGGDGDDFIGGESGADILHGGQGNDFLHGGHHNDQLFGETGNDELYGMQGDDTLDGGQGDDFLSGGLGWDVMTGGSGADTFYFHADSSGGGHDMDVITDFNAGEDIIRWDAEFDGPVALSFLGDAYGPSDFNGAEIWYLHTSWGGYDEVTYVQMRDGVDNIGSIQNDYDVVLVGHHDLSAQDFDIVIV